MWQDPIVLEVRKATAQIEKKAGGDFGRYIVGLRKAQQMRAARLVSRCTAEDADRGRKTKPNRQMAVAEKHARYGSGKAGGRLSKRKG